MSLIQSYAITKVQLAEKQSEFEELSFKYLKLEKQLCALKLEVAKLREIIDDNDSHSDDL